MPVQTSPFTYLQIDDGPPFIPDSITRAGFLFGQEENQNDDPVKSYHLTSQVVFAHYVYHGKEFQNFYRTGKWGKFNDTPLFQMVGLLTIDKENAPCLP